MPEACPGALACSGDSCQNAAANVTQQKGTDHVKSYQAVSGASEMACARLPIQVEAANTAILKATGKYKRLVEEDLENTARPSSPPARRMLRQRSSWSSRVLTVCL